MTKKSPRKGSALKIISIILCFAVFIGATYAWFSDEAKTGEVNITAGNLDVEIVPGDTTADTLTSADSVTDLFTDLSKKQVNMENWEPGMMVISDEFKIANKGTLAFQYKVSVDVTTTEAAEEKDKLNLLDRIKYKVVEVPDKSALPDANSNLQARLDFWNGIKDNADKTIGKMAATDKVSENPLVIVLFWEPDQSTADDNVDNRYNIKDNYQSSKLTATFKVNVFATQTPEEIDSFGDKYDGQVFLPGQEEAEIAKMDEYMKGQGYLFRSGDKLDEILAKSNYCGKEGSKNPYQNVSKDGTPLVFLGDYNGEELGEDQISGFASNGQHTVYDLNSHKMLISSFRNTSRSAMAGDVTIKNGTIQTVNQVLILDFMNMQNVTLNNLTVNTDKDGTNPTFSYSVDMDHYDTAKLNMDNVSISGGRSFISMNENTTATINNCNFTSPGTSNKPTLNVSTKAGAEANITNSVVNGYTKLGGSGTFNVTGCTFKDTVEITNGTGGNTFTFTDTTFDKNINVSYGKSSNKMNIILDGNTTLTDRPALFYITLTIKSGTYGFDPTPYKASNSTVTANDNNTWTVTAGN